MARHVRNAGGAGASLWRTTIICSPAGLFTSSDTPRMPSDRRRLVAVVAALLLTIGSGLLVGGALIQTWVLVTAGAVLLVGATVVLTLVLGNLDPVKEAPEAEPQFIAPFEVPLFERLSDPVLLVDRQGLVLRASASTA